MAVYYVDFVNGLDANNGLGPDASHASNKPWKTIAKLLGAAGMASGDTAYLSPAGPFREVVTVAMTSAVAETKVLGDPANQQGFKTSGGVAVQPGDVIWTAYTTNDTTTPSANALLNLSGRDYLTFQYIHMMGGNANPALIAATTATSTNITIRDCYLCMNATNAQMIQMTNAANVAFTWLFDRCTFFNTGNFAIFINGVYSGSADYDLGVTIQNCRCIGGSGFVATNPSGAGAFHPGGVVVINNTMLCSSNIVDFLNAVGNATFPHLVYNNYIRGGAGVGIRGQAVGQVTEDRNIIISQSARTNVTAGANSITNPTYNGNLEIGQAVISGRLERAFGMPVASSPLLNFGSSGTPPAVDALSRPRPAGAAGASYALGALERHDTGIAGGTANADAGNCLQLGPGPADHEFQIPVKAVPTVISIKQKTSSYGGTAYPQITLLANGELGVTTQTVADSSAHTSYTTLTLASFTPTKAGWVTLRLQNLTNDGAGIVYWDTASLPGVDLTGFDNFNRSEPFPAIGANLPGRMDGILTGGRL